jgi:hypothetical protein
MTLDVDAIERHLQSDDPTHLLLRGHLWIEEVITELIRVNLLFPDWEDLKRLSFLSKIGLATALGEMAWTGPYLELNRLRNKLAHDPTFEVDHAVAKRLAGSFESDFGAFETGEASTRPALGVKVSVAESLRASLRAMLDLLWYEFANAVERRDREARLATRRLRAAMKRWAAARQEAGPDASDA